MRIRALFHKHGKLSFKRLFVTYIVMFLLPTSLIVFFVQTNYISALKGSYTEAISGSLNTLMYTLDRNYTQMAQAAVALSLDADINDNYYPDDPVEVDKLKKKLGAFLYTSLFYNEISMCCVDDRYIFSNNSSYSLETFIRINGITDYDADSLYELLNSPTLLTYIPSFVNSQNTIICLYPTLSISGKIKTFLFSIPESRLLPYCKNALSGNSGLVCISDNNGNIIFNYKSRFDIPQGELEKIIGAEGSELRQGRDYFLMAYENSNLMQLQVTVLIGNGEITRNISQATFLWVLMVAVSLIMGIIAAIFLSNFSYKPIMQLDEKVTGIFNDNEDVNNEFQHISESIEYLSDQYAMMQSNIDDVNEYLTFRLFKGEINNIEELNQLGSIVGISLYAAAYQIGIISFINPMPQKHALLKLREALPTGINCLIRSTDVPGTYAVALFYSGSPEDGLRLLKDNSQEILPDVKFALGSIRTSIENIPFSYMEAELVRENLAKRKSYIQAYADICKIMLVNEKIDRLEKIFKEENFDQLPEFLSETNNFIIQHSQFSQAKLLCLHIIHLIRREYKLHGFDIPADEFPDIYILLGYDSHEKFNMLIEHINEKDLPSLKSKSWDPNTVPLIERMCSYLCSNYQSTGFSIQQMASDFGLLPSTLSKYFKNNSGNNINDYLTNLKIDTAKKLLIESSLTIYEIGMEIGYYGPNSFIRRFKAVVGMTPGEYRSMHI